METDLLPEQKKQLKTWSEQRDELLLEISNLQTGRENEIRTNKNLSETKTSLINEINQIKGRLEEINKKEEERLPFIIKDISELETEKTQLETIIKGLKTEISLLEDKKFLLLEGNAELKDSHDRAFDRINSLDKIIDHVTRVSKENIIEVNNLVSNLKESVKNVVDINQKNVSATNVVIEQLPKVFFDVQRKSLEREVIKQPKI